MPKSSYVWATVLYFLLVLLVFSGTRVSALSALSEHELSDITAQEGIIMDFESLNIGMTNIQYTDADGNGTGSTGEIQLGDNTGVGVALGSISNSDADLTMADISAVNLTGLTIDADGGVSIGGNTGGVVIGLPNGTFDIASDNIYLGSPSSTSNTFGVQVNGIDVNNTTIEIGANP